MAAARSRRRWFGRSQPTRPIRTSQDDPSLRVLTAAATRLNLEDKKEARRMRQLRQGWQSDAWAYRDAIPELRYGTQFLANCAARMRLYPAAYPLDGESDNPVRLAEIANVPPEVSAAASQALADLGTGRLAIGGLLKTLSTNTSVPGECFLIGDQDPQTGADRWAIRSIGEIVVYDDRYKLVELPGDSRGEQIELDPATTVISRIWTPHPQFRLLADSPMRALLDDCESLMILRRMIRAAGRSRLAGAGLLLIPDQLSIKGPDDDNADSEADPFMAALTQAMMAPIADEGVASAVVPIVARGPGEFLDKVKHVDFGAQFGERDAQTREELVGIIATGLDLPKEVITGIGDLNHWSAWQVDDNTFRHHVEPHVIECCDALTGAYFRPYLNVADVDPEWVQRLVLWYDPTELVTHPDRTQDAKDAHSAMVISDKAYRDASGFTDEDAPTLAELERRRLEDIRALPLNLLMEYARRADPTLVVPPITVSGTVPGIKPGGVDVGALPPSSTDPSTAGAPVDASPAPSPGSDAHPGPPPPITAAGAPRRSRETRLSRKLTAIDRDLRTRLQTAANAAMLRQLERAGARLRTKVAKDETLRAKIAQRPNERVAAILGQDAVTAAAVTAQELIGGDWGALKDQYYDWTEAAQRQAIATALRIGSLETDSDAAVKADAAMAAGRDEGWALLSGSLTDLGHHLLYNPHPDLGPGDWADLNPDTLVPTGTIRAVLGVVGGAPPDRIAADDTGALTFTLGDPIGQVGTGATVSDLIMAGGGVQDSYEWSHGPSLNGFEPHEDLDGTEFDTFDSDALANSGDFPATDYFMPGDHNGCTCDFTPLWLGGDGGQDGGDA